MLTKNLTTENKKKIVILLYYVNECDLTNLCLYKQCAYFITKQIQFQQTFTKVVE